MSARNQAALKQMAGELGDFLSATPETCLQSLCHTTSAGRRHFEVRAAIPIGSIDEAIEKLIELSGDSAGPEIPKPHFSMGQVKSNGTNGASKSSVVQSNSWFKSEVQKAPKIGWLFDDVVSSNLQIARELYQTEPSFRELMAEFDAVLAPHREPDDQTICESLQNSEGEIANSETMQFALQAGLVKLLQARGVSPDAVLGLGVGQYTAACVAGCLCFKDAIVLIEHRQKVLAALKQNSGPANGKAIDETQIDAATKTALDEFETFADSFNFYPPNLPLICSLEAAEVPIHRSPGGSYWRRHCLEPAKRNESAKVLADFGLDYLLDLSAVRDRDSELEQILESTENELISVLHSEVAPTTSLQTVLAILYAAGAKLDFSAVDEDAKPKRISLPPYPFQKKRYWITEVDQFVGEGAAEQKQLEANTKP